MKRALVVVAAMLAVAAVTAGILYVAVWREQDPGFSEADAEAAVQKALDRCEHNLRDARELECRDVGDGFACRADGRFVAGFDDPDPDQPEFSVVC